MPMFWASQWHVLDLIYAGSAAYSVVVPLSNSTVGVVYERDGPAPNLTVAVAIVDVSIRGVQ